MAFDQKRFERVARASASDLMIYNKDKIIQSFKDDNFFEALKDSIDESRKNFEVRSKEAAATNILERAIVDSLIFPMGSADKYPMF